MDKVVDIAVDERFMREALREAMAAEAEDEIPIGAVIVFGGRVIAKGHNMTERLHDPTAHAEMIAITAATEAMGGKYLNDCTLYVTVEPCPMCAWAILQAGIKTVYFGSYNLQYGAMGSVLDLPRLAHSKIKIYGGLEEEICDRILKEFFEKIRR